MGWERCGTCTLGGKDVGIGGIAEGNRTAGLDGNDGMMRRNMCQKSRELHFLGNNRVFAIQGIVL
jgi:hypothetical protein